MNLGRASQDQIDRFKEVLPGLAMSMSEIPKIREQGLKILKKSVCEFDTAPLAWLGGRDFIKAHPEAFELVDAENKRRQKQWDVFYRRWKQSTRKRASRRPRLQAIGPKNLLRYTVI